MRSGTLPTGNTCWRADCNAITLLSGTIYRWTTCDRDLFVGGNTYTSGALTGPRTARQAFLPEIDSIEVQLAGAHKIGGYTLAKHALDGLFDDARVSILSIAGAYPGDVSGAPSSPSFEGRVAGLDPMGLKLHIASDVELLSNLQLPRFLFQASCGHVVYDANCGLSKGTFTVAGTVLGSPTPTTSAFAASGAGITAKADDYFNLGTVAFDSGTATVALRGVRRAVADFVASTDTLTLALPLPVAPAAGDTFTVYPGCPRTYAACAAFSNTAANRGFAHIPPAEGGE